jgi:hypothetical protein
LLLMQPAPSVRFQDLLREVPRGTPLATQWLGERGLNTQQVARLAQNGWLERLGRGVYLLPGDQLDREASLAFLASEIAGLHVAGKTALAWRGVRHSLATKERLVLWGERPATLPGWFTRAHPASYQATHLFDAGMSPQLGLGPLPAGRPDLPVSEPERAILELLSDVGKRQGLEEARHLVEAARSLRLDTLEELLRHLKRIKVARLAHWLADDLDLPWKSLARACSERLGGGKRWVAQTRTGDRLNLKRPM